MGCGYVGSVVAKHFLHPGKVFALTRNADRSEELRNLSIEPIVGNWLEPDSLVGLPDVDVVLVSVPHREVGFGEQTHCVGLKNLTDVLPQGCRKIVYLSTTGVYGRCNEEVVNEETPVSPTRIGPKIAVQAENWLAEHRNELPTSVTLRLAGIYGPGRIPLAQKLKLGEPLAVPQQGYLNLAHVEDIASIICVALDTSLERASYVFSDGSPTERSEFYKYLAGLCGVDEPIFVKPDPNDPKVRRATSKRVDPSIIVTETQFKFAFPDYRSGLAHALESES